MFVQFIALFLLLILFPIFVLISFIIIFSSGHPIFYKHKRYGLKFKEFNVIKFRTMIQNNGPELTEYNDSRITKIGEYLRRYKLDELPQLINIIKGEMSFFGPRPESINIVNKHKSCFQYLNLIKPGISGVSSIIFKDEALVFKNLNIQIYEKKILPIKFRISSIESVKSSVYYKSLLFIISIISIINHNLSLYFINFFFLNELELEFRVKLNKLLLKNYF